MLLKREIIDVLISKKIYHFVLFCDNVLNYHGDEDCYYEEWYDDIKDQEGWICFVNTFDHVLLEMKKYPELMKEEIENIIFNNTKMIKTG